MDGAIGLSTAGRPAGEAQTTPPHAGLVRHVRTQYAKYPEGAGPSADRERRGATPSCWRALRRYGLNLDTGPHV